MTQNKKISKCKEGQIPKYSDGISNGNDIFLQYNSLIFTKNK